MSKLSRNVIVAVGIVGAVLGIGSRADGEAEACKADAKKFCSREEPGGGRVERCLKKHESELSPACRATVAKVEDEIEACRDDVAKVCWEEKPGNGGILKCLKKNRAHLSEACRSAIAKPKS